MIDFENGSLFKLRRVKNEAVMDDIIPLLTRDEKIIGSYKTVRDFVVFTTKRIIAVNVQGIGKKKDYTSLPYKKVNVFSVETSGVLDIDSEMELYFSGLGKVRFEFTGGSDIVLIGRMISEHIL